MPVPINQPANKTESETELAQSAVWGIHTVEALLKKDAGRVHRVVFKKDSGNPRLYSLQKLAKQKNIHTQQLDSKYLDQFSANNQGVVALCHERPLDDWDLTKQMLISRAADNESLLVVIASNIEDPRNLGACMRSSLAFAVDALILPARGSCGLTPAAAKTSSGAIEKLVICKPPALETELDDLIEAGFTLCGLDAETETLISDYEFPRQLLLIVGGEDQGIPPYLAKKCAKILKIPMNTEAHSFNASVALSLALYERSRQANFGNIL
jgi:23S rRNA (guanosine2251-2'-O)-methyltransferase